MDTIKFNDELNEINKKSYGYGNEILYLMAQDPKDLQEQDKLAGAMWLIGRSYAASPQRRSYGTMINTIGYKNLSGILTDKCPIWPVRTQNDGRENFFDDIAHYITEDIAIDIANELQRDNKPFFGELEGEISLLDKYDYDKLSKDYDKLIDSICLVLEFNLLLSKALENFDDVPKSHVFSSEKVYCSNHISFASKFLHFYFPHRVFIIDNFAREGAKCLFNGYSTSNPLAFYDFPSKVSDSFDIEIYEEFSKKDMKKIYSTIVKNRKIGTVIHEYNNRLRNKASTTEDNATIKDYIEHCIRSYLLGCYIVTKAKITPINQIKYGKTYSLESMPRLTDAVFLNIKSDLSPAEKDYLDNIKLIYGVTYI